jgi:electron transfer flavoprotein beta subunit
LEPNVKIIVCVKTVPDSAVTPAIENGVVDPGATVLVINPWDEYAVEAALQQKEAQGGTVTAVSVGDETAQIALRHALAMGADEAVCIPVPAPAGLDSQGVARLLAAAVAKTGGVDLVFCGRQGIDGESGLVPAQLARLLGWPLLSLASSVKVEDGRIRVERNLEEGRQTISSSLPAVVSLTKDFGEPRFPTFLNKRKAERAEIHLRPPADLGVDVPAACVSWSGAVYAPARAGSCEMLAGTAEEIAGQLVERLLAEKLI